MPSWSVAAVGRTAVESICKRAGSALPAIVAGAEAADAGCIAYEPDVNGREEPITRPPLSSACSLKLLYP
jgi:hypothetical protein